MIDTQYNNVKESIYQLKLFSPRCQWNKSCFKQNHPLSKCSASNNGYDLNTVPILCYSLSLANKSHYRV